LGGQGLSMASVDDFLMERIKMSLHQLAFPYHDGSPSEFSKQTSCGPVTSGIFLEFIEPELPV
jgi:hypothetical protein